MPKKKKSSFNVSCEIWTTLGFKLRIIQQDVQSIQITCKQKTEVLKLNGHDLGLAVEKY